MSSFISKNPYTRKLIQEIPFASRDSLLGTIGSLDKAYKARRKAGGIDRSNLKHELHNLASNIEIRKDMIAGVITSETGKVLSGSMQEVQKAIGHIKYFADHISELTATKYIHTDNNAKTGYFIDPLGVIYKVIPFNFPFWTPIKMIIPSLVAGNAILLRPANSCPLTALAMQEIFKTSGLDTIDIAFSSPEDTDFILSNPAIQGLSFTGSTKVGKVVGEIAGRHLKKAVLELGGNDPFIVLADADIDLAVSNAIKTRLNNNGQVCNAAKRFIIHKSVFEQFANKLEAKVKAMRLGDPTDPKTEIGPLARDDLTAILWDQVNRATLGGDTPLFGAVKPTDNMFIPTGFKVKNTNNSVLMEEELFGPVFSLIEFDTVEEAIRLANQTQYGLGAAIMTRDLEGVEQIIRQIDAGMVFVNTPVGSHSKLPSGGIKQSGYGRDSGAVGVEAFANIKTFSIRK